MAEDEAEDFELENMDFTTCKEKIVGLQADRERRLEATERLQEKLKALNNELAARRLEADQRKLELKEEQQRNKQRQLDLMDKGEEQTVEKRNEQDQAKVRNQIEEMLAEKSSGPLKKQKPKSEYGFRIFDETDLMVEKTLQPEGKGKEQPIDTVLVTYQKPNSDDVRYHLSFRVSKDTPSKKLREDACNYWGLSEVEYILLTVDNSKVHDDVILQHCFKATEDCRLILAPKDPRRTVLMDKEWEATKPKLGRQAKKQKTGKEEDTSKKSSTSSFTDWLQTKPGMWDFMTQRDQDVYDHVTRITLRSIIIYASLFAACLASYYWTAPPGQAFYMRQGPILALTSARGSGDPGDHEVVEIPPFSDVKTQQEAWTWLTYQLSDQLMVLNANLRQHNYMVGWLRIRMQQVKAPNAESCEPKELTPDGTFCVDEYYNSETAGIDNLHFTEMYWEGYNATTTTTTSTSTTTFQVGRRLAREFLQRRSADEPPNLRAPVRELSETEGRGTLFDADAEGGHTLFDADGDDDSMSAEARNLYIYGMAPWTENYQYTSDIPTVTGMDGRSSTVKPYKYKTAAENSADHGEAGSPGIYQSYDASGYNLDYDLQYPNLTAMNAAFRADMLALREREWFTNQTSSIVVQFTLFNGNFELWTHNEFLFEMPASAVVVPSLHVNIYRPTLQDVKGSQAMLECDIARLVFALYILVVQVYCEFRYARAREERSCFTYFLTPYGFSDICIGLLMIVIFVFRQFLNGMMVKYDEYLKDILEKKEGFISPAGTATLWRMQTTLEAPLFCLVLFRLLSLLRVNRQMYIVWKTLQDAAILFIPFCLVLVPVALGITVWAHTLWHDQIRTFTNLPATAMSLVMMVHGDIDMNTLYAPHRPETLIFGVVMFILVWIMIVNAWIAVLVHVYQTTRVAAGFNPSIYKWKEKHWISWICIGPLAGFYFKRLRKNADKPKKFADQSDDDD